MHVQVSTDRTLETAKLLTSGAAIKEYLYCSILYIFFGRHPRAYALHNAQQLCKLLSQLPDNYNNSSIWTYVI